MDSEVKLINRKIHGIVGGLVFLCSLFVYSRTVAPTTSYWDCGEFISCSYNLGVMHPPGAPLYLLIGRIMTMFPFFKNIGLRVNVFSVIISTFTVLFTYLIIVQLIGRWRGEAKTWKDRLILYVSGAFGALALGFTDCFWFNAVEAEVYGFSMFFTALVVWLALYWGERSQKTGSLLLIFFIFYMFGLATGVHLLNILAFPFVLFIAFFHENQTVRRLLLVLFIQVTIPISLYIFIYQFDPSGISYQDLIAHQGKAWNFLKWFGTFWMIGSLVTLFLWDRSVFKVWWIIPVFVILGYSTYIAIYIRAGLSPPINMNNPSTLEGMSDYFARKQYGEQSLLLTFMHRKADFWQYQLHKMYTRYFGWQFIGKGLQLDTRNRIVEVVSLRGLFGLPFLVGLGGAIHHFLKDWKRAVAVLVLFFLIGYAIVLYVNQPDPQPRERDYSYIGSFFAFSLWIGIGMAGLLEWISSLLKEKVRLQRAIYCTAIILLFIAVPINLLAFNFNSHDRSGNYVAWNYSYNILQTCEPNAILFTGGDNDTYPLWYLQVVEGIRKDVRVVCLSLLNSQWYIRQLRDKEPKVVLNLSDRVIEGIRPVAWSKRQVKIAVPEHIRDKEQKKLRDRLGPTGEKQLPDSITFTLAPTFPAEHPQALRMQDLLVIRILQANQWERPIYFAITVSPTDQIGLDPYLRMDGLAYKVMPHPVREIDPEILRTNLLGKFSYRGFDDPGVHFNLGAVGLLSNVRQVFLQMAMYYNTHNQNEEALSILNEMSEKMPEEIISYSDERMALAVTGQYRRAGGSGDYENRLQYVIPGRQVSRQDLLQMAEYYSLVLKDNKRAEEIYRKLIQENPDDVEAYSGLFRIYSGSRQYNEGIVLLERWIKSHPEDMTAKTELDRLRKIATSETQDQRSLDSEDKPKN